MLNTRHGGRKGRGGRTELQLSSDGVRDGAAAGRGEGGGLDLVVDWYERVVCWERPGRAFAVDQQPAHPDTEGACSHLALLSPPPGIP